MDWNWARCGESRSEVGSLRRAEARFLATIIRREVRRSSGNVPRVYVLLMEAMVLSVADSCLVTADFHFFLWGSQG